MLESCRGPLAVAGTNGTNPVVAGVNPDDDPVGELLGPNSIGTFCLEFWLEKPLEFLLEISLHYENV